MTCCIKSMMGMLDMEKIANLIQKYQTFAVCGHVNPDGDCIGSCVAFCRALRLLGKQVQLLIDRADVARNLLPIWDDGFCTPIDHPEVFVALDCADADRLLCGREPLDCAPVTVCIDHHKTNTGFAQVNMIDPPAAATGELVFALAAEGLQLPVTQELAIPLYAAIASDTGSFRYSNTTPRTHRIAARLLETGMDFSGLMHQMFGTHSLQQLQAQAYAVERTTLHFDGKAAVMTMSHAYLEEHDMTFDDVDFLSALPRDIEGVEVGVYLKEKSDSEIKVSLRSNQWVDVAAVAASFGGGGHVRAAGATIVDTLEAAKAKILAALEEVL